MAHRQPVQGIHPAHNAPLESTQQAEQSVLHALLENTRQVMEILNVPLVLLEHLIMSRDQYHVQDAPLEPIRQQALQPVVHALLENILYINLHRVQIAPLDIIRQQGPVHAKCVRQDILAQQQLAHPSHVPQDITRMLAQQNVHYALQDIIVLEPQPPLPRTHVLQVKYQQ